MKFKSLSNLVVSVSILVSGFSAQSSDTPYPITMERKIKELGLEPHSTWARGHAERQKLVPYDKCTVMAKAAYKGLEDASVVMMLGAKELNYQNPVLFCYTKSKKLKVGTAIPVKVDDPRSFGAGLGLSYGVIPEGETITLKLKNLDGKSLEDVFGRYTGLTLGAVWSAGLDGSLLVNKHRVFMGYSAVRVGFLANAGAESVRLSFDSGRAQGKWGLAASVANNLKSEQKREEIGFKKVTKKFLESLQ